MSIELRPNYFIRTLDATSQWLNTVLLNGNPNESISGRCYREGWIWAENLIDAIFFWEDSHCQSSYLADLARAYATIEENK